MGGTKCNPSSKHMNARAINKLEWGFQEWKSHSLCSLAFLDTCSDSGLPSIKQRSKLQGTNSVMCSCAGLKMRDELNVTESKS